MIRAFALTAAAAVGLSGCAGSFDTCQRNPAACIVVAGLIIAAGVAAGRSGSGNQNTYPNGNAGNASDSRLKTDIRPAGATESGVPLYTFRYLGSRDHFIGPLADELQTDPRFAHAVHAGHDGFLRVDFAALGLDLFNAQLMADAGERAIRIAAR